MLSLIVNLVVFIGALVALQKKGFDQSTVDTMLAGMTGANALTNVSSIIVGILTLSPGLMISGLVFGLLNGYLCNLFIKRAGV